MRRFLAPRWLLRHLLVLTCVLVFLRLGWWQWQRTESPSGTLRNFAYAVQWPMFGILLLAMWWKAMRLEVKPPAENAGAIRGRTAGDPVTGGRPRAAPPPEEEVDEELEAYNRYLRWLHEQDQAGRTGEGRSA